jgi:hypothetical protein
MAQPSLFCCPCGCHTLPTASVFSVPERSASNLLALGYGGVCHHPFCPCDRFRKWLQRRWVGYASPTSSAECRDADDSTGWGYLHRCPVRFAQHATAGATIYCTADGSVPSAASSVYSIPFSLSAPATFQAMATASSYSNSAVGNAVSKFRTPAATYPLTVTVAATLTGSTKTLQLTPISLTLIVN